MVRRSAVTKKDIVEAVVNALSTCGCVHAVWEGGAIAFGRADRWSDIDLYVLVDDGKEKEAFAAVENGIRALSGVKAKYDVPQTGWPGVSQAFYKIDGAGDYLTLDLAIVTMSSGEKFLDVEIHGVAVFHLLRSDKVQPTRVDKAAFAERLGKRVERLKTRDEIFSIVVQKEINRGNLLEAFEMYRIVILDPLVEALRMLHNPYHHDFRIRYVYHELPKEVTDRLEELSLVRDLRDLQAKYRQALKWYREVLRDLESLDFTRSLV